MARIAPPAEVLDILLSGDFARLIGVIEDEHIEFKEQPYQLTDEDPRMKLAKDVSALANVHEGLIVMALEPVSRTRRGRRTKSFKSAPSRPAWWTLSRSPHPQRIGVPHTGEHRDSVVSIAG